MAGGVDALLAGLDDRHHGVPQRVLRALAAADHPPDPAHKHRRNRPHARRAHPAHTPPSPAGALPPAQRLPPCAAEPLLRCCGGDAPAAALPQSHVLLRRIRYTPLSPGAVADATRCSSMYGCYGALPAASLASASVIMSVSVGE